MRLSLTLSYYISRQFLVNILFTLLALMSIGMLIDIIELIRRVSGKDFVAFSAILEMSLLKAPFQGQQFLPFAVLIGSMLALTKLTRSQELVIARSVGVSVWQFLMPAVMSVLLIGVVSVTVFNPLSAVMLMQYEQLEGKYITGRPSLMVAPSSGLWLRQKQDIKHGVEKEYIMYALRLSSTTNELSDVTFFLYNKEGAFEVRIDAKDVSFEKGKLNLRNGTISKPGEPPKTVQSYELPTTLRMEHIQDSFASPETLPFWSLPGFIKTLEKAGFSGIRHRLYWQGLLASPLLMVGMLMVAAVFSLRLPRRGKIGLLVAAGAGTGFVLFFLNDLIKTLGLAGTLPVFVAAWTPACIMLVAGTATLLQLEDG